MLSIKSCLFISALLAILSCQPPKSDTVKSHDTHSFSNPEVARVTHLHWKATVNFDKKIIQAIATWDIQPSEEATQIIFDTKKLSIDKISIDDSIEANYTLEKEIPIFGQALVVKIKPTTKKVSIYYQTSPEAEAIQWLSPQQTADKKYPFLFTQSQAILARSWIPCQDSPGVRFTYDADVTVPPALLALMSATNPQELNVKGEYHFEMKQSIPSYLLALVVGDVSFKPISERSGIYAEPSVVGAASWEFADLEKMIGGAEQLYGPYAWDRYDVIVLPPSFPFGGMENPRLTFATPTILAGDRSLTSLIAHELAHSWSGNLVTNSNWNDFWLNEGFTVYFETRIMEKLYGRDYAEMLASLSLQDLKEEVKSLTDDGHAADTKLKLDLTSRSPDDGVTEIAYNKGYFFLRSIEEQHGRDKFDAFLNYYFSKHAFTVMDTDGFIESISEFYKQKFNVTLSEAEFKAWIFSEGLPSTCPQPVSTLFKNVDEALKNWNANQKIDSAITNSWSTHEWLHFLMNLPASLTQEQLQKLDELGKFTNSHNAEILTRWLVLVIRFKYTTAYPKLEEFLIHTGRRKFLSPLYTELIKTGEGKKRAQAIYAKARGNYHFVATNTFDALLK